MGDEASSKHAELGKQAKQAFFFVNIIPRDGERLAWFHDSSGDLEDPDRCAAALSNCRCGACWVSDICASRG